MKSTSKNIAFFVLFITGLGLLFIGTRFFFDPLSAEHDYGIHVSTTVDFSFHYIKGVRDIFSGAIIVILLLAKEFRALGMILLCATIIPLTDFLVVISHHDYEVSKTIAHLIAIVISIVSGIYYLRVGSHQKNGSQGIA